MPALRHGNQHRCHAIRSGKQSVIALIGPDTAERCRDCMPPTCAVMLDTFVSHKSVRQPSIIASSGYQLLEQITASQALLLVQTLLPSFITFCSSQRRQRVEMANLHDAHLKINN